MTLPAPEIEFLASISGPELHVRLRDLHQQGWSLASLANSLTPPRPRATVHYWIANCHTPTPAHHPSTYPPPPPLRASRAISPNVPPEIRPKLQYLASLSRRHRAKQRPDSPQALASAELTDLALQLRSQGIPTAKIAQAAGISYRAMHKRLS